MRTLVKKFVITSFLLALYCTLIPNIQAEAATSPQYPLRPDSYGDFDSCMILSHGGGTISVRIWQQGIHAGEQAYTVWTLETASGSEISATYIPRDFDGTIAFYNVPKGDYILTWKSLTNNDTEGWYKVYSNGGTIFR